jgi:hypothetical protein
MKKSSERKKSSEGLASLKSLDYKMDLRIADLDAPTKVSR